LWLGFFKLSSFAAKMIHGALYFGVVMINYIINFLYGISNPVLYLFIFMMTLIISFCCLFIVRCLLAHELRYNENGVIGAVGSSITVLYAVIMGFTAFYIFDNYNQADAAVQREASVAANIYRYSLLLPAPMSNNIQNDIREYIQHVIHSEWTAVKNGKEPDEFGNSLIDKIETEVALFNESKTNPQERYIQNKILTEVQLIFDAREKRIAKSKSALGPDIWFVILLGAFFMLCINFLFGATLSMHIILMVFLSAVISSIIFLIVALNFPFRGEFGVSPEAFQSVLTRIIKNNVPK
jgi:Protein of unknown function (DUF4239)